MEWPNLLTTWEAFCYLHTPLTNPIPKVFDLACVFGVQIDPLLLRQAYVLKTLADEVAVDVKASDHRLHIADRLAHLAHDRRVDTAVKNALQKCVIGLHYFSEMECIGKSWTLEFLHLTNRALLFVDAVDYKTVNKALTISKEQDETNDFSPFQIEPMIGFQQARTTEVVFDQKKANKLGSNMENLSNGVILPCDSAM